MASRRPTKRQSELARILVADPNISLADALRRCGYSDAVALHHASETVQSDGCRIAISSEIASAGIRREKVYSKLSEALDAQHTVFVRGKVMFKTPDNRTRLKAVELAMKAFGDLKGEQAQAIAIVIIGAVERVVERRVSEAERAGFLAEVQDEIRRGGLETGGQ
jgi:hypothetical protein